MPLNTANTANTAHTVNIVTPLRSHGLTLLQLIITLAIMATLATLSVPAIQSFVSRSALRSLGGDFTNDVQFARSEALNHNQCVAICMSSTVGGANTCATTGEDWAQGWIVFRFPNCGNIDNTRPNLSPTPPAPADEILALHEGVNARYQLLRANGAPRSIVFNPRGAPNTIGTNFLLQYAPGSGADANDNVQRRYCMGMTGRIRSIDFQSSCS